MPRLGGASQQSYLLNNMASSGSQTVTNRSSPSSDRDSFSGVYVHQQVRGKSSSPPSTGQANARSSIHRGSGSVLPNYSTSPAYHVSSATLLRAQTEHSSHSEGSLRRRTRFESNGSFESPILSRNSSSSASYQIQSSSRRSPQPHRLSHIIQCVVLFVIFCLVWDSHRKVEVATDQLLRFQKEESYLLTQMTVVEGRADELRAKIKAMKEKEVAEMNPAEPVMKTMKLQQDLAHLEQEDQKLAGDIKLLQKRIQKSARESIVKMYGEGTIHVNLSLKFDDGERSITLELSDETPHAVWVWLQQIGRHDWDDSMFRWKLDHVILATPAHMTSQNHKLEFIESNPLDHVVHSVALSPGEDGGIRFYINLMDNGPYHESDVCIGKVVGGFDNLKKLLSIPIHQETKHLDPAIPIRSVTVTSVPSEEKQIK